jgi:hypothetical protein
VCGRAGAGKTTLLARLLAEVGDDRVIVIEDAPELSHPARHTVHLRTRPSTADGSRRGHRRDARAQRDAHASRPHRDRRGPRRRGARPAAGDEHGHDGSATTVHANGVDEAVVRLEGMALLAGVPQAAARSQVAAGIDALVALGRARRDAGPHGRRDRRAGPRTDRHRDAVAALTSATDRVRLQLVAGTPIDDPRLPPRVRRGVMLARTLGAPLLPAVDAAADAEDDDARARRAVAVSTAQARTVARGLTLAPLLLVPAIGGLAGVDTVAFYTSGAGAGCWSSGSRCCSRAAVSRDC